MKPQGAVTRVLLAVLLASVPGLAAAMPQIVVMTLYGIDNRVDLYAVNAGIQKVAESTTALFHQDNVWDIGFAGVSVLRTQRLGDKEKLLPRERFAQQGAGAFCSGSLVGPDLVLTAGHCVTSAEVCSTTRFVFGFALAKPGDDPNVRPTKDIYSCKQVVKTQGGAAGILALLTGAGGNGADWALLRLDREVKDRKPLELADPSKIKKGARLFVIGHPDGLPAKVAGGATVTDDAPGHAFKADLDTFHGNSGSPVFELESRKIVGVLVRGGKDYTSAGLLFDRTPTGDDGLSVAARALDDGTVGAAKALGLDRRRYVVEPQGKKDAETVTRSSQFSDTLRAALNDRSYAASSASTVDVPESHGLLGVLGRAAFQALSPR